MVVHGYTLDEVTDFIAQKSSTNITTNHSYAVLTTYVNERHGFLGLAKHNQSSKIYGFYPTDEVVGFDYVSASIIWCTAFNALTIATILLVSTLYQVGSTFGAAAPIISTAAIAYDLSRGKDSYIDKSLTYSHILDIASSATQKSLSFYNKLNDAIGVLPSTATIFCVGLLSTTAFAKYMYGNKLAYSNLALHASTATTTIFSKNLGLADFSDHAKTPFNPYSYVNQITKSLSFKRGNVQDDKGAEQYSKENKFPKISFAINEEQYENALAFIEAVKKDCESSNVQLCKYQALSKNCYQFVQDLKEYIGLGDDSYYSYLSKDQQENLFINDIPMIGGTWKFHRVEAEEITVRSHNDIPGLDMFHDWYTF